MNKWLAGNGRTCPGCGGRGWVPAPGVSLIPEFMPGVLYATRLSVGRDARKPCPTCGGDGRVAILAEEIVGSETTERIWQPDADGTPPPWPDPICPRAPQCRADRADAYQHGYQEATATARRATWIEAAEMAEAEAERHKEAMPKMPFPERHAEWTRHHYRSQEASALAAAYRAKAEK